MIIKKPLAGLADPHNKHCAIKGRGETLCSAVGGTHSLT